MESVVGEVVRVECQITYCVYISVCWNLRFYSVRRVSLQVKANGVDFHCEQFGYGDHTVLLLPGAIGGSMTDFNCQLEKMNPEKFTIFGFDPRGYGRSIPPERDWPINFRHRDAEDAVAVMNTLGQKRFSVLGFSDGGTIGLILAAQYPEHVRKLVVWGANAYLTEEIIEKHRAQQWVRRLLPRSSKTAFKEQFHHNVRFYSVRRVSLQVKANGVDFHCEQFGYGDHTVLLLPGAIGGSMTDFNCQLEKMNPEKFTIFGFDPRGYGRSIPPERDWPINFRHRDAEDAVAVMNTLGQKKFSVLGWSDGGITGLLLASQYPELVQKLVVWGTNAYITDKDMKMYQAVEDIDQWSARMKEPFIQVYGEKYFRVQWSNWVKAYSRYYTHNKGDICKAELKKITCPTFIIHGMKDPMVVAEHPVYLNKHIQNSRLHNMPEGKHNIHLRYADEFNKMVEDFLLE
ncbi:valacyclovir hydrolase-like isoform X2 [Haliotis rubra]|uniref:valacyclovir hydrolase-like isoform X2 n=1 Tax=Haliotis rubra TaxID=36100 RepID=UPI001EE58ABC|nr:valacyclovir hydrolase-like isoform X2 [Haliotis rubra]